MKVAVEGCCHGELDKIYETLQHLERVNNIKIDLLLICGDFQAVRNRDDLKSMAVPQKYQKLNTFYKYYSGEKVAPVLTIFIGGNHEASNYMQELPYGGWVAKNIYYMGYANVIQVGGLRIGGLSGIYKERDFHKGHYEHPPYTEDTKRSVYHIRNIEVFRLKQLTRPMDIFMSHDWPADIARYGNMEHLFKKKPFLRSEVMDGSLGSPPAAQLLNKLQPSYWFSAHLHVKYSALVLHSSGNCTKFLSLDKCLPRRQFLQVLDFPDKNLGPVGISLDPEWLSVLQNTNHLMKQGRALCYMPTPQSSERHNFEVSDEDIEKVTKLFEGDLILPENFKTTAPTLEERKSKPASPPVVVNPQTALLCSLLDLTDPNAVLLGISNQDAIASQLDMDPSQLEELEGGWNSDDDVPSDINSSIDKSGVNSSLDMSDSFSSPFCLKSSSQLSTDSPTPPVQVDDDDKEFQAILAAQRRNSLQAATASQSSGKSTQQKTPSSLGFETKISPSSLRTDDLEDELALIMVAKRQNSEKAASDLEDTQKLSDDAVDKSSSDVESTSQDSQEEVRRSQSGQDSSKTGVTECIAVSSGGESLIGGQSACLVSTKHPSPNSIVAESPSVKKLKRRNISVYSSSGTEEEPC